jgi:hypothetical protein
VQLDLRHGIAAQTTPHLSQQRRASDIRVPHRKTHSRQNVASVPCRAGPFPPTLALPRCPLPHNKRTAVGPTCEQTLTTLPAKAARWGGASSIAKRPISVCGPKRKPPATAMLHRVATTPRAHRRGTNAKRKPTP